MCLIGRFQIMLTCVSKDIIWDILCSVAMSKKDLHQLSMNDLRARLALQGNDFDGSKESLISRLKKRKREAA